MLPLGDDWTGACCAVPGQTCQPDASAPAALCNLGYARGVCKQFPEGDGPDAVRFTIAGDDGVTLRLYYVVEQNHHPFAHGPMVYSQAAAAFAESPDNQALRDQAQAYVRSYLRRKSGASGPLPASIST